MSESRRFTRRQVVSLATTGTTVAMAGCLSTLNEWTNTNDNGESHQGSPSNDNASSGEHETEGSTHEEKETSGHGHGDGIGPATERATVQMMTTGEIGDVLTGQMDPVSFVTENRNHFEPHIVHITVGGTVTWVNKSGRHDVVAYHPRNDRQRRIPNEASAWSSDPLTADESFSHTFPVEGIYDYYCSPHEGMGMIGSIVVGNPSVEDQPGLKPPADLPTSKASTKIEELNRKTRTALTSGTDGGGSEHDESGTDNSSEQDHGTETENSSESGHGSEEDGHSHGGE